MSSKFSSCAKVALSMPNGWPARAPLPVICATTNDSHRKSIHKLKNDSIEHMQFQWDEELGKVARPTEVA